MFWLQNQNKTERRKEIKRKQKRAEPTYLLAQLAEASPGPSPVSCRLPPGTSTQLRARHAAVAVARPPPLATQQLARRHLCARKPPGSSPSFFPPPWSPPLASSSLSRAARATLQ